MPKSINSSEKTASSEDEPLYYDCKLHLFSSPVMCHFIMGIPEGSAVFVSERVILLRLSFVFLVLNNQPDHLHDVC